MHLDPKPFDATAQIYRRKYYGAPYIYADVDINQSIEIDEAAFQNIHGGLGLFTKDFQSTLQVNTLALTYSAGVYSLNIDVAFGGGFSKAYWNKVAMPIPLTTHQQGYSGTLQDLVITFWLIVKQTIVTFAEDANVGGINGPGLNAPLASSDAYTYADARVAITSGQSTLPSIGSEEIIVGLLAAVSYEQKPNEAVFEPVFSLYAADIDSEPVNDLNPNDIITTNTRGVWASLINLKRFTLRRVTYLLDWIGTTFPGEVLSLVRKNEHTFLRTQTYSFITLDPLFFVFNVVEGVVYISRKGNSFIAPLPVGGDVKDIQYKDGVAIFAAVPTGTVINIKFTTPTPGAPTNFLASDTSNIAAVNKEQVLPHTLPIIAEEFYTLLKTPTKWEIIGFSQGLDRRLKLAVLTLQNQISALGIRLASIEASWIRYTILPADITVSDAPGFTLTTGYFLYHKMGKTLFWSLYIHMILDTNTQSSITFTVPASLGIVFDNEELQVRSLGSLFGLSGSGTTQAPFFAVIGATVNSNIRFERADGTIDFPIGNSLMFRVSGQTQIQ